MANLDLKPNDFTDQLNPSRFKGLIINAVEKWNQLVDAYKNGIFDERSTIQRAHHLQFLSWPAPNMGVHPKFSSPTVMASDAFPDSIDRSNIETSGFPSLREYLTVEFEDEPGKVYPEKRSDFDFAALRELRKQEGPY